MDLPFLSSCEMQSRCMIHKCFEIRCDDVQRIAEVVRLESHLLEPPYLAECKGGWAVLYPLSTCSIDRIVALVSASSSLFNRDMFCSACASAIKVKSHLQPIIFLTSEASTDKIQDQFSMYTASFQNLRQQAHRIVLVANTTFCMYKRFGYQPITSK
ncbi:hypothetical protein GJ496_001096 [Pomphorhynchus laevis]|nr:hypothetical protein GJ496_001096 [Pomphorhynchus laevis]